MTEEHKTALLQQIAELREHMRAEHETWSIGRDTTLSALVDVLSAAVTALLLSHEAKP